MRGNGRLSRPSPKTARARGGGYSRRNLSGKVCGTSAKGPGVDRDKYAIRKVRDLQALRKARRWSTTDRRRRCTGEEPRRG